MSHIQHWYWVVFVLMVMFSESNSNDQIVDLLSGLDNGPFAKPMPENITNASEKVLLKLAITAIADLQCSYAYTFLLHLKLTKSMVTDKEMYGKVAFRAEAQTMLESTRHTDKLSNTADLMWTLTMYTELVHRFATGEFENDGPEAKRLRSVHDAVTRVFEEFTGSCIVHDQHTGQPRRTVTFLALVNKAVGAARDTDAKLRSIRKNKESFKRQADRNRTIIPIHSGTCLEQLQTVRLRLNDAHLNREVMALLIEQLGMFASQNPFASRLSLLSQHSLNASLPLHQQMYALVLFQYHFVHMLKAIALRIVLRFINTIYFSFNLWFNRPSRTLSTCMLIMSEVIRDFIHYVRLVVSDKDLIMLAILQMFKQPEKYIKNRKQIYNLSSKIVESLRYIEKSTDFRVPLSDIASLAKNSFRKGTTVGNSLVDIASKNGIKTFITDPSKPIKENVMRAELFISLVYRLFEGVDFDTIRFYANANQLKWVKRLEEIERTSF